MKKSDLKTGMRVKLNNGSIVVVLLNTPYGDIMVSLGSKDVYLDLDDYDDNFLMDSTAYDEYSIDKVWDAPFPRSILADENAVGEIRKDTSTLKILAEEFIRGWYESGPDCGMQEYFVRFMAEHSEIKTKEIK